MGLESINAAMFKKQKGTFFHLSHENLQGELDIQLIEVQDHTKDPNMEVFTLIFKGPLDKEFIQENYVLDHHSLGEFQLLIVPFKKDAQGVYYQAIINRMII